MSTQRRSSRGAKRIGLGLLAGVLAFTVGCSADDIMGPGTVAPPAGGPDVTILVDPQGKAVEPVQGASFAKAGSAFIRADEGGVISWGRFSLDIPAGALSEDTEISISRPMPNLVMCELEPHGIQFNKPVTLQIDYNGTPAAENDTGEPTLGVYWFNEDTGQWVFVGKELDTAGNKMEANLEHFSGYVAGWKP